MDWGRVRERALPQVKFDEDAVQEGLIAAQAAKHDPSRGSLSPEDFAVYVTVRRARGWQRDTYFWGKHRENKKAVPVSPGKISAVLDQQFPEGEHLTRLAILRLPATVRREVLLSAMGFSAREGAAILGETEKVFDTRQRKGRKLLGGAR